MELINIKCPNCGANLDVNQELEEFVCNYCGTKSLIDDEGAKITRIENAKLQARKNNYEQDMYEKREENKTEWKEVGRVWLILLLVFVGIFIVAEVSSYFGPKNPSLSDYNSLIIGMTYGECKEILGTDGHLVLEEKNVSKYVWYDIYCSDEEDCDIIIELNFENDKLISRKETNLK